MITLEIVRESDTWDLLGPVEAVAQRAAEAAAQRGGAPPGREASLLLTDDAALRDLNRRWRDQDRPTNVLSFPAADAASGGRHLGDIAIALETLRREAEADGIPPLDHLAHLVVHGILHLLGRDHDDPAEADAMESLEVEALAAIGVADPYRDTVPMDRAS